MWEPAFEVDVSVCHRKLLLPERADAYAHMWELYSEKQIGVVLTGKITSVSRKAKKIDSRVYGVERSEAEMKGSLTISVLPS